MVYKQLINLNQPMSVRHDTQPCNKRFVFMCSQTIYADVDFPIACPYSLKY